MREAAEASLMLPSSSAASVLKPVCASSTLQSESKIVLAKMQAFRVNLEEGNRRKWYFPDEMSETFCIQPLTKYGSASKCQCNIYAIRFFFLSPWPLVFVSFCPSPRQLNAKEWHSADRRRQEDYTDWKCMAANGWRAEFKQLEDFVWIVCYECSIHSPRG